METKTAMQSRLVRVVAQFLAAGFTTWVLMTWFGGRHTLLYVWPLTAVPLALALGSWHSRLDRSLQLAGSALGELAVCSALGIPLWIGLSLSIGQSLEVWAAGEILSRSVTCFQDLKKRVNVLRLGIVAVVVPALFERIVADPFAALTHSSVSTTWKIMAPADTLGLAIGLPALLFLLSGEYLPIRRLRPYLAPAAGTLGLFLATSVLVFAQSSSGLLFLIFPPLTLVLFALGLEGAAVAVPLLAVVACIATAHGYGPALLIAGSGQHARIFGFQVFVAAVAEVALSVGALLDERKGAGRAAEEAQSIYQTLIQNTQDMIILSTLDGAGRFASPAVEKITGWTPEEFVARGQLATIHPDDRELARKILASLAAGKMNHTLRYRLLCKDVAFRWVEANLRGYRHSGSVDIAGYVATVRDISAQKEAEDSLMAERAVLSQENQYLADLAARDELTGVANRRAFNVALEQEALRHTRLGKPLALLMVDVDYFKMYNDRFGHQEGDVCLKRMAETLQACVGRVSDLVARVGGEEFAVLLPNTDEVGARKVALDMLNRVRTLAIKNIDSPLGRVTISVGMAIWPSQFATDTASLLQQADRALYESKRNGRNRLSVAADVASVSSPGQYRSTS